MRSLTTALAIIAFSLPAAGQFQSGDIYVSTCDGVDEIYRIDPTTYSPTLFASGLICGSGLHFIDDNRLLAADNGTPGVWEFDAAGSGSIVLGPSDGVTGPYGSGCILEDADGNFYIGEHHDDQILKFDSNFSNGKLFADASDGINNGDAYAFHANGDILVGSRTMGPKILKIAPDGTASIYDTLPSGNATSIATRNNGDVYLIGSTGDLYRYAGGNAANRALIASYGSDAFPALAFNPDHTVLYMTLYSGGSLWTVDPATGDRTLVRSGLPRPNGIQVPCGESITEYGTGLAGAGGLVPGLHGSGSPIIGGTLDLAMRDFVGGAPTFLAVCTLPDDRQAMGGRVYVGFGELLVFLPLTLPGSPGVPGDGDLDLSYPIPDNESLVCLNLFFQQFGVDSAAVQGVSMTNGLRFTIGE